MRPTATPHHNGNPANPVKAGSSGKRSRAPIPAKTLAASKAVNLTLIHNRNVAINSKVEPAIPKSSFDETGCRCRAAAALTEGRGGYVGDRCRYAGVRRCKLIQ